jgi:tellurite resistance protein
MLPTQAEREKAFNVAVEIALADFRVDLGERQVLTRIRKTLELHHNDLHE